LVLVTGKRGPKFPNFPNRGGKGSAQLLPQKNLKAKKFMPSVGGRKRWLGTFEKARGGKGLRLLLGRGGKVTQSGLKKN